MRLRAWSVAVALAGALVPTSSARAAAGDYCVAIALDTCTPAATLADALAAPDRVRVFLGPGTFTEDAADGGTAVEIDGAGRGATTIDGTLDLTSSGSLITGVRITGDLDVAGRAELVDVGGAVGLLPGAPGATAQLAGATVGAGIIATGPAQIDDADVTADATAPAVLEADCARVLVRGMTTAGAAPHAVQAGCATSGGAAEVDAHSSVLAGADPVALLPGGTVTTDYCQQADDPDAVATDRVDPGASRVDAGDPAPLAPFEGFVDAAGNTRVTDGDGDGVVRRDIGAYEAQPPAVPVPAGNVLADPGAESPLGAPGAAPPGWTGTFTAAAYGDPSLPGLRTAAALGAGQAMFSAAGTASADLLQRIDLTRSAAAIDTGHATAALSGLLGGYGADPDTVTLTAAFRDVEGTVLGTIALGPVPPDARGRDTNLLWRSASAAIPPRTRAIDVTLHGERLAGSYTDAYADNLALVLNVPGVPVPPPVRPQDPIVPRLRPFSGVAVLTGRPEVSRHWRTAVLVVCPSDTVGRCTGTLRLVARLPHRHHRRGIARTAATRIVPGTAQRVTLRLTRTARRRLARRRTWPARLLTVAQDGQGIQRRRTVPVRLRLPATRRRRAPRAARSPGSGGTPAGRAARPAARRSAAADPPA